MAGGISFATGEGLKGAKGTEDISGCRDEEGCLIGMAGPFRPMPRRLGLPPFAALYTP
jgi:hypothetical protein